MVPENDTKEDEDILLGTPKKKSRGIYYNPLLYCTSSTGKTYYFKYFRAYPYDHRMLLNDDYGEPIKCQCPKGKIHHECSAHGTIQMSFTSLISKKIYLLVN